MPIRSVTVWTDLDHDHDPQVVPWHLTFIPPVLSSSHYNHDMEEIVNRTEPQNPKLYLEWFRAFHWLTSRHLDADWSLDRDVTTPRDPCVTWHVNDLCDLSVTSHLGLGLTLLKVTWGSGIRDWIWTVRSRWPVCPVCDWWVPTVNTTFWWSPGAGLTRGWEGGGGEGIPRVEEVIYWFLNRCGICRPSYDWEKIKEMLDVISIFTKLSMFVCE